MSRLESILAATRAEVERRRHTALGSRAEPVRDFRASLTRPGVSLVAEHKRRSPSAGAIREDLRLEEVVAAYERGGAVALSVLTEGPNFGGSLEDLRRARAASSLPILRKDFTVDAYQVREAFVTGADAILLIVAALQDAQLAELHDVASELGLSSLVEVHDQPELERALAIGAEVVGINNRDLSTLKVDLTRAHELRALIPDGVVVVAESGFSEPHQLHDLARARVDGVLIGEALMRAPDIESRVRAFVTPTM